MDNVRPIPGYEGFAIGQTGVVFNLKTRRSLREYVDGSGAAYVLIRGRKVLIDRALARCFSGEAGATLPPLDDICQRLSENVARVYTGPGIYVLYRARKPVYVGKARNVFRRVGQHCEERPFDEYRFIPCKEEDLDDLERHVIALFDPKLNRMLRPRSP